MITIDEILPLVLDWAMHIQRQCAHASNAMTPSMLAIAHAVGVVQPESIQLVEVERMPIDDFATYQQLKSLAGLKSSHSIGMSLGYTVFILKGQLSDAVLAHEFRHVSQFEAMGSLEHYLTTYLTQLLTYGYQAAPMELDALRFQAMFETPV